MIFKPAGYWFKQREYTDPSFSRQSATTTGRMLNQVNETNFASATLPKNFFSTAPPVVPNRRHPMISNRISEHDNRNLTQHYGEYFSRGFGKRLVPKTVVYNHDWILSNSPRPIHPDRSITQRDYRGWPALDHHQTFSIANEHRKKPSGEWMKSCYDDFGRTSAQVPNELLYREEYKRIPIHPWHY